MSNADEYHNFNERLIADFRANQGQFTSGPFQGAELLLLTTTGAKSGKPRTTPLAFTRDGDRLAIVASKAGAPTNPDWYHNLLANPVATVELGPETFQARASVVADAQEHDRLYDQMVAERPNFDEYRKLTSRHIPVIVLERVS